MLKTMSPWDVHKDQINGVIKVYKYISYETLYLFKLKNIYSNTIRRGKKYKLQNMTKEKL